MTIVSLIIGGVVLVAMIAIAVYGWVTLPADARVPVHHGLGSYGNFVAKPVGLIVWPASGAVLYAILGVAFAGVMRHHPGRADVPLVILPLVLILIAFFEWGAIGAARRTSADQLLS